MRALVTGGTGFIGSHLIERLLREKTEVHALVRNPRKLERLGFGRELRILPGDLVSLPVLPADLDVVFHLAGITKAAQTKDYYRVNQAGTASLLAGLAARKGSPRFVHLSTQAAGGPTLPSGRPRREDDPPSPVSPYGRSKLKAEEEVLRRRNELSVVLLRVGPVFGPRDEDFLDYFRWVKRGWLPRFGRKEIPLSAVYVADVVSAALLAARPDLESGEIFNIAAEEPVTWESIGRTAARLLGRRVRRLRIPLGLAYLVCAAAEGVGRITRRPTALNRSKYAELREAAWTLDVSKAKAMLGFTAAYSLEDGLRETLDWYSRQGLL
ncbi:MAG: NAD(P)-dependent oxidoreductase [Candidatus Aminicenantes bacterium]|nr:NAD(P)-dependent oxidoreductase [Candidatus Aminicenantes bacterium]